MGSSNLKLVTAKFLLDCCNVGKRGVQSPLQIEESVHKEQDCKEIDAHEIPVPMQTNNTQTRHKVLYAKYIKSFFFLLCTVKNNLVSMRKAL